MPSHRDQRGGPTRGGLAGRGGATRDHDVAGFQLMDVKGTISQDMTVASDIINHSKLQSVFLSHQSIFKLKDLRRHVANHNSNSGC